MSSTFPPELEDELEDVPASASHRLIARALGDLDILEINPEDVEELLHAPEELARVAGDLQARLTLVLQSIAQADGGARGYGTDAHALCVSRWDTRWPGVLTSPAGGEALEWLCSETMAAALVSGLFDLSAFAARKNAHFSPEAPSGAAVQTMCRQLAVAEPDAPTPAQLTAALGRIREAVLPLASRTRLLSRPLFPRAGAELRALCNEAQLTALGTINQLLCADYGLRRAVLLKRLDVTLASFAWNREQLATRREMLAVASAGRAALRASSQFTLHDVAAASADLLLMRKTSHAALVAGTRNDCRTAVSSDMPRDRGGRVNERVGLPSLRERASGGKRDTRPYVRGWRGKARRGKGIERASPAAAEAIDELQDAGNTRASRNDKRRAHGRAKDSKSSAAGAANAASTPQDVAAAVAAPAAAAAAPAGAKSPKRGRGGKRK